MNPLIIEAEDDITPAVTLDSSKNVLEISGWSHPEDAIAFYTPVLEWLNQYEKAPNAQTEFHFRFQYYNTASAKQIFRLISSLEDVAQKSKVKIHWHYDSEDTDMLSSGERFSKMSTVPFEFVSH
ncbi:MAG: DUF1987 domain-containing protein [Bacteroidetes bacterium]|nr:DUF1987 domain-containing protein [Bacteroidota bacterium]